MNARFDFKAGPHKFSCALKKNTCSYQLSDYTKECNTPVLQGGPYCPYHMSKLFKLRLKPSTIPVAGNGVYAWDLEAPNRIVFKNGDYIIEYTGEILSPDQLYKRYGPNTAPYTMATDDENVFIDSACVRTMGALINGSYGAAYGKANTSFVVEGKRVFIRADRNIVHGEELFIDYGSDYGKGEHRMNHKTIVKAIRTKTKTRQQPNDHIITQ